MIHMVMLMTTEIHVLFSPGDELGSSSEEESESDSEDKV